MAAAASECQRPIPRRLRTGVVLRLEQHDLGHPRLVAGERWRSGRGHADERDRLVDTAVHRSVGSEDVRAAWEELFRDAPQARVETEETVVAGDRVVVRWRYSWGDGHVRGVDLFRVRGGRIAEKLSYVKG